MKKIIFIISLIFSLLIFSSLASAAEVCVVVDFSEDKDFADSNRYSECFDVNVGDTALSVLEKTSLNIVTYDFGGSLGKFICSIDGVGGTSGSFSACTAGGSWSFFTANRGNWKLADEGVSNYKVKSDDLLGFKFDKNPSDSNIPKPAMLIFSDIEVRVDGDKDSSATETGGSIDKDVKPGSNLKFDIKLENLYEKDTDIDIEDITLDWTIENIDDGDDIDGDEDIGDIEADKSEKVNFEINIPYDVEEEDFDMFIEVEGDDNKGINHKIRVDFTVEINKESHELIIKNLALNPETVDCERKADLRFTVMNIGGDDEDDVEITVKNNALGLSYSDTVDLVQDAFDDDNNIGVNVPIIVSDNVKPGSYPISIKATFNDGKEEVSGTKNLIVKTCSVEDLIEPEKKEEEKKVEDVIVVKKPDVVVQQLPTSPTGSAVATKIVPQSIESKDDFQLILLVLEGLAIIIIISIIIAVIVRRRK